MDDDSRSDKAIVPDDKSRELSLPSEMIHRGLELAVRIEERLGIQSISQNTAGKEFMVRCYPSPAEPTRRDDRSGTNVEMSKGENRPPVYLFTSVDKDGIHISCASSRHHLNFVSMEGNEDRYRLLNNSNGSDPFTIPVPSFDIFYIIYYTDGKFKTTLRPSGEPGYTGAIPEGVIPKGRISFPKDVDDVEIVIIYTAFLMPPYSKQDFVEKKPTLILDFVVIDPKGEDDPTATRELYHAVLEVKKPSSAFFFNEGEKSFDKGDYDQAIANYDKAIELKPDYGQAFNNRGLAYHIKGDYDRALSDFIKAVEILPSLAEVYGNRGLTYLYNGDYQKAILDFNKAIQFRPGFAGAFYNRGLAFFKAGSYENAIANFDRAIHLIPKNTPFRTNPEGMNKNNVDNVLINNLKTIHFGGIDVSSAYTNRGCAYLCLGDYQKAIADINQAIELQPDLSLAYYDRAGVYYSMGDYDKAINDYKKVLELHNDPAIQKAAETRLVKLSVK
jgi:tetratricopeptide (TPR) repeat protein